MTEEARPQWLAEGPLFWDDGKEVLPAGIPRLCPERTDEVKAAVSGKYERWFHEGTYTVAAKPAGDIGKIAPGTYRVEGPLAECYWERTREDGRRDHRQPVRDVARKITVTIAPSDDQFTSENCGTWKPVK
ncbi:hypothetical protein [Streptomyces exfoliatus]|uniref:hypothetical protein n=1 Tax=Streptomyces exfoliatus TaxID=1905 RepID=UPI003C301196